MLILHVVLILSVYVYIISYKSRKQLAQGVPIATTYLVDGWYSDNSLCCFKTPAFI